MSGMLIKFGPAKSDSKPSLRDVLDKEEEKKSKVPDGAEDALSTLFPDLDKSDAWDAFCTLAELHSAGDYDDTDEED